jgi:hypothetical protein
LTNHAEYDIIYGIMLAILLASECEYKQMNINARSRLKHSATVILYAVLMAVIIIGIIAAWIIVSGRNRIAIDEVYGNVIVERSGGQISAKQGMRLESGDCVKVLSGGSARITLGRDRYIYPEADSAVTVTRSKEDKSFGAELLTGAAAVRLDKAADIKVSALNVIVTASGSVFRVSCTDNAAEIICADGEADISGGGTAQKLAAGSLARLTSSSGEIVLTLEEAEVSALPESALKSLMRIASQRSMTFSLNSLGGAYLALDDNIAATEISEAVSESIAETTVSETTVSETETSPSEETAETVSEPVTEISETSASETNISEATTFETTFSETTFSETTSSQTTASETQTSDETVSETTAPTVETTQTTTPTIPWWEIINSAERDSR